MRVSKGFNEIPPSAVRISAIQINGEFQDHKTDEMSISTKWIADTETKVDVHLELDLPVVYEICKLGPNEILLASVRSYCQATTIQHFGEPVPIDSGSLKCSLVIPEFEWSDQAVLKFSIVVSNLSKDNPVVGKASLDKSRLFEKSWSVVLSGTYSRVDVQSVLFYESPAKRNALWEIFMVTPTDIPSWTTVEQSAVVRIRINESRLNAIESDYVESLLKVDVFMAALATIFNSDLSAEDRDSLIELISSPPAESGSWLKFLSSIFAVGFPNGSIGSMQYWRSRQNDIRTRVQSYIGGV